MHPGELRGNARLGTQGTQVEGDKNNEISKKFTDEKYKKYREKKRAKNQVQK